MVKKRKHHGKRQGLDALRKRLTSLQVEKRENKVERRLERERTEQTEAM